MIRIVCVVLALAAAAAGCGGGEKTSDQGDSMTVRRLDPEDTTGLSEGRPRLTRIEIFRDPAGAVRARGRLDLPDGTRLQFTAYPPGGAGLPLGRTQLTVRDGRFESPPLLGSGGPLPPGDYRFQLLAYFDPNTQPDEVMRATGDGRRLRGPGITRGHRGRAAFVHNQDVRL